MNRRRRTASPLPLDLSDADIVADLVWPHRPPGQWDVPGQSTAHVDALLRSIERDAAAEAPIPRPRRRPEGPAG